VSGEWTVLCAEGDVDEGDVRRFVVPGLPPLALFNVDGRHYATDDTCTHAEASLSDGTVDGEIVECPFHGGCFHIPTGRPAKRPVKTGLRTYEVGVEDGWVKVRPPGEPDTQ
jgi:nitrite reductase/ring-hydroxylating ferredoxin subunit